MRHQETILILAPRAQDAEALGELRPQWCSDVDELGTGIDRGAGIALVSAAALTPETLQQLRRLLESRRDWSDFSLFILGEDGAAARAALSALEPLAEVALFEPPLRAQWLAAAVRSALRRREQRAKLAHELRNPLAALRNALNALRLKPHDPESAGWARALMERQVAQMTRLIDELADPHQKKGPPVGGRAGPGESRRRSAA